MYPVSEAFLSAVQENTRRYYWTGKITTKAGVVHEFSEKEIVKGSGYISAQCCGSTEMVHGTQATDFANFSEQEVIAKVGALFTADQKKSGILASVFLAQFILESGYGKDSGRAGLKAGNPYGNYRAVQ